MVRVDGGRYGSFEEGLARYRLYDGVALALRRGTQHGLVR
jgi:hypothetical protein